MLGAVYYCDCRLITEMFFNHNAAIHLQYTRSFTIDPPMQSTIKEKLENTITHFNMLCSFCLVTLLQSHSPI